MAFSKHDRRTLETRIRAMMAGNAGRSEAARAMRHLKPYVTDKALVRIGSVEDGGYLLPDDLDGIGASFSPGVSTEIGFDTAICARGIPSFLADASVQRPANLPDNATFDPLFLGPRTEGHFISLDDWVGRYAPAGSDLLLQMDIEGAEYDVLDAASDETLSRFRIVALEYHRLYHIFRKGTRQKMARVFQKMARHFTVAHIHPNNAQPPVQAAGFALPPVFEVTYLRRDRVSDSREETRFPHPLDRPNVADHPDFPMPPIWTYGS